MWYRPATSGSRASSSPLRVEQMSGRFIHHTDDSWYAEALDLQVTVTDNPIIGRILGPNGETLAEIRERPPIGFR
jgi:hypothetical protein